MTCVHNYEVKVWHYTLPCMTFMGSRCLLHYLSFALEPGLLCAHCCASYTAGQHCIGFIWDAHQHRFDHHVLPALHWFKASEGHMGIPAKLVLDEAQCREAGLPEHVKEFRLGQTVRTIRSQGIFVQSEDPRRQAQYTANKEMLDSTNFIWDHKQHRFDRYIKPAMSWFKALEGHAMVPQKLVMDEMQCRNARLPEHVKEFRLGGTVNNIRGSGDFVQTADPSREAQCTINKDWLENQGVQLK